MGLPTDVESIFFAALEISSEADRIAYLDRACGGDPALRDRVERLLAAHPRAESFLAESAFDRADFGLPSLPLEESSIDPPEGGLNGAPSQTRAARKDPTSPRGPEDDPHGALAFLRPSEKPDSIGRLAHYEVTEVLGQGASGIVVRAFDEKLGRHVAIKVLSPFLAASPSARERFGREARTMAAVHHENVIAIHGVEDRPIPYLVMEFLDGSTLQQRLDEGGPLPLAAVRQIGQQIAAGLAAAHAKGLMHRDIKPSNILIERGTNRVKLTDFGLARAVDDVTLSRAGTIAGTPMYMAPEQTSGGPVDQAADLFSLGSVLYVMCCGHPPFSAENSATVLRRIAEEPPRPLHQIAPRTPVWLQNLIAALHAKSPGERTLSASDVAELLASPPAEQADQTRTHAPRTRAERPKRAFWGGSPHRWNSTRLGTAFLGLVALLGGLGFAESAGVTDLGATVIRAFFDDGTLVVGVDDPDIGIKIDGSDLVFTGTGVKELRVSPGPNAPGTNQRATALGRDLADVARNGRHVLKIRQESAPAPAPAPSPPPAVIDASLWLSYVAGLNDKERTRAFISRMKQLNPGLEQIAFDEFVDIKIVDHNLKDLSPLRAVPGIQSLGLHSSKLQDISVMRGMDLVRVDLFLTQVSDLSPLASKSLRSLDLSGSARVVDLSPLAGLGLESLTIHGTGVSDLSPLKGMNLKLLNCNYAPVADLSPIQGLPLRTLQIQNTRVTDLSAIGGMGLATLQLDHSAVSNLSPLKGIPLAKLTLVGTPVVDLSPLEGMPLRELECDEALAARHADLLSKISTLETVNRMPVDQFQRLLDEARE